jgi:competence protein ComEC
MTHLRIVCLTVLFSSFGAALAVDRPATQTRLEDVSLTSGTLRVHFIDVGPGLAVLIETPSEKNIFIDGGERGTKDMMKYLAHFVGDDESISMALVTHPDYDHYKGLRNVLKTYDVQWFVHSGYTSDELGKTWGKLLEEMEEKGAEIYAPLEEWVEPCEYEVLDPGTASGPEDDVTILYLNVDSAPPKKDPVSARTYSESERRNNASIVFKIEYGETSFLFTGDINGRDKDHELEDDDNEIDSEEFELLQRHNADDACLLEAMVLQAPHHGSNGSCSLPFLKAVQPEWVVFPAGHKHNHPHLGAVRRVREAGVDDDHMLRTDFGDMTPERRVDRSEREPEGDDSYIFVSDGTELTHLHWVKVD